MYDRAARDLIFKVGCTPSAVGPGSYESDIKAKCKGDGYAPFLSMSSRETCPKTNEQVVVAPGPGHYDVDNNQDRPKGKGPLAYKSKRFTDTISETPGPGAYQCHKYLELGYKPRSAPGLAGEDGGKLVVSRIRFHRKPEAPSIPSTGQAYGYEECDDGTLKKQEVPQKDTTLGPAFYSPIVIESKATQMYKGIHFGKLSSGRMSFVENSGPGPGSYNPYEQMNVKAENANIHGEEALRYESYLPRYYELIPIQEHKKTVPGPGAYNIRSIFTNQNPILSTDGIEIEHPPFMAQAKRFSPARSTIPAPGTYNDPRTALEALNKIRGMKRSPFSQTAVRFNQDISAALQPGPGAYNIPGLGAESMRKAYMEATRKGVFGTTAPRAQPLPMSSEPDMPGPAHYQVMNKPAHTYSTHLGSNFASVTRRLKTQENDAPPPGTYDIVAAYDKCQVKPSMAKPRSDAAVSKHGSFMSAAPRFARSKNLDSPGPASYNVHVEALSKKGGLIATREKRFREDNEDLPGPGTYELSPLNQDTVLRGSFNHTLGNPVRLSINSATNTKTTTKPAFILGV